ncbi:vicilin-like antimicrobial peptides 2-2 [Carex littledalei]|uniref:Vicilin-like antimicrobial peptides 2-2 n=1 Tax=Carex littledalei TaxID=544730 RepID=A0A833QHV0_9POAL|nr:vicilin-like antimicrobial peptides 2-2 [Carex littledalei]
MAMQHKTSILIFLLFLFGFFLSMTVSVADESEDPELTECLEECRSHPHYDIGMQKRCEDKCNQEHPPGKWDPRQGRGSGQSRDKEDPEQRLAKCRLNCRRQYSEHGQQMQCQTKCEETYKHERSSNPQRRYEEQEGEREEDNPYVFGRERLRYEIQSDRGYVKVLDKFHEKSKLLLGIANYSISLLVANPRTFVTPVHFDADCVCYVVEGRGTVTTLRKGDRKSHGIRKGDVFVTQAGSVLYLISSDLRQKLVLAKFLRSNSLTGQVSHFYAAGSENPESVYRSFSDEILEAAFNVPRDRIESIFSRQWQGAFVEASEEQIRALSRYSTEGGRWPFGESRGPFNLFEKDPIHSNRYGKLYEANSDDYRKLGWLNLRVSLANIREGSMIAPFYNSRSTKFAVVTEGSGYIEILCPHVARRGPRGSRAQRYREHEQERRERRYREEEEEEEYQEGPHYRRVRAHVSRGTVFIVPPGHPVVEVASRDQNLQTICFEISADRNERIFLAGRNNILRKLEREAKELAFDTSAREVDAVFDAQKEEVFLPGPGARRHRHDRGESEEWGGSESDDASLSELLPEF